MRAISDPDSLRFDAIRQFIENCAGSSNNKFAVIGFGKDAGIIQYNQLGRPSVSCEDDVRFSEASDALADLDEFKNAELKEREYYRQWLNDPANSNPTNFYDEPSEHRNLGFAYTSYTKAGNCIEKVVFNDLLENQANSNNNYTVFFLSDGRPLDPEKENGSCEDLGANLQAECYKEGIVGPIENMVNDVEALRRSVNIFSVGYGSISNQGLSYLNSISKIVSGGDASKIDEFSDSQLLCQLISTRLGIEVRNTNLTATVMTLKGKRNSLSVDSDVDGISDDEEGALGYDPLNARSVASES